MTRHEALDDWLQRSQDVLDDYEAHRVAASPDLGHKAVDAALAAEEASREALRGSDEEIDAVIWQRTHPSQTSPNFYV